MSAFQSAASASLWLSNFFDCGVTTYSGQEVQIDTICSVIALPYGERWRVRIAWMHSGDVTVHVSECPTGEVTLNTRVAKWEDAAHLIGVAVSVDVVEN